jgi:hypothetical protein
MNSRKFELQGYADGGFSFWREAPASLTVYSLVLLRDWHRAAKVRDEGPGSRLERPGASPSLSSLSYETLHGLLLSHEEVFAALDGGEVKLIDVGRVVVTSAAVNFIHSTVGSEDRVIFRTTEQDVFTEPAIYAVVTASAPYLIVTTATVAIVVACPTYDRVCGTEPVDAVQLRGACELIRLKSAPYILGQRHPAEHDHSYQQSPAK